MVERKSLDQFPHATRVPHLSLQAETAYVSWVRSFILSNNKRHPEEMDRCGKPMMICGLVPNREWCLLAYAKGDVKRKMKY